MPFTDRPPFYLVWKPSTGYTRKRHDTLEAAQAEAQRMSDKHDAKFHVLVSLGRCTPDKEPKKEETKKRTTLTLKKK